jgi:pyruvate/2-oxoglutarate dehydrogenase complex dihydrolipoamide acyltransferase (E2) component
MLAPVRIPDLGAGGQPQRLSAWFVDPGELLERGDRLFEVLIGGVTCDVAAEIGGRLSRIEKPLDAPVSPGDVAAWIETTDLTVTKDASPA